MKVYCDFGKLWQRYITRAFAVVLCVNTLCAFLFYVRLNQNFADSYEKPLAVHSKIALPTSKVTSQSVSNVHSVHPLQEVEAELSREDLGKPQHECADKSHLLLHVNGSVSCVACKECTQGFGLRPICGSTITRETSVKCEPCQTGMYSSVGVCVPCSICTGPNAKIRRPCTRYEDTECVDDDSCQPGFYFETRLNMCVPCSPCCSVEEFRHLKCVKDTSVLHCSKSHENDQMCKRRYVYHLWLKKPGTSPMSLDVIFSSKQGTKHTSAEREKRDINMEDSPTGSLNVETEGPLVAAEPSGTEKQMGNQFPVNHPSPTAAPSKYEQVKDSADQGLTTKKLSTEEYTKQVVMESGPATVEGSSLYPSVVSHVDDKREEKTAQKNGWISSGININTVIILVFFLAFLIFVVWFCARDRKSAQTVITTPRRETVLTTAGGPHFLEEGQPLMHQITGDSSQECYPNSCDVTGHFPTNQENCVYGKENQTRRVSGDVDLSSIPEDLMGFLVKKLDIREENWMALGLEMGFPRLDVEYFGVEYKSESGSPTRTLLRYGGARGKTLNNLIAALSSRDVGRCDIGSYIQNFWIIPQE